MDNKLRDLYIRAVAAHEAGEYVQAAQYYDRIITYLPNADLILYNQGLALFEIGRFREAAASFTQAAVLCPDNPDIHFNLGLAFKQTRRYSEARRAYEQALALQPEDLDILFNLANCCREGENFEQAARYYEQLLTLDPDHAEGLNNFAYLCHRQQEYARAKELYQRLLDLRPDHAGAAHMLAALRGRAESTPANEYVRDLFDQYSENFEQSLLDRLKYRVPDQLFTLAGKCDPARRAYAHGLDLGCGTGLAGLLFKPLCRHLIGVDLSEKMLAKAAEKGVYDQLVAADIVQFMEQEEQHYDLLLAADLLTYLADLNPLMQAAVRIANPGCLFVFSIEESAGREWQVQPTGRFAHNPEYVAGITGDKGWKILCSESVRLRREAGAWVQGKIFAAVQGD